MWLPGWKGGRNGAVMFTGGGASVLQGGKCSEDAGWRGGGDGCTMMWVYSVLVKHTLQRGWNGKFYVMWILLQ